MRTKCVEENVERQLQRGIRPWMASLIVLGGIVSSAYFVGSGWLIQMMGPSVLLGFLVGGLIIFVVMQSLGELLVNMPRRGSFIGYTAEFVGPLPAVANGYSYWFSWITFLPSEALAGGIIMNQLFAGVPGIGDVSVYVWAVIFLGLITFINLVKVKSFGMIESILSLLKIFALFLFSIVAIGLIVGLFGGDPIGTNIISPTGQMSYDNIFVAGWLPLLTFLIVILFNFMGSEVIGLAASETHDPKKTVPKACKQIVWRIIGIYLIPTTCLIFILSYTDSSLEGSMFAAALNNYAVSMNMPWLSWVAGFIGVVVLVAAFSCANCGMFSSARSMFSLSVEGMAPKVFSKLNKHGVPMNATLLTLGLCWVVLAIAFFFEDSSFYIILISMSSLASIVTWIMISLSQVLFRRRIQKRGYTKKDLIAPAPLSPFLPIVIGIGLELAAIIAMPFSGDEWVEMAFLPSVLFLFVPPIIFLIVRKGKVKLTATRQPDEQTFDELFPDKTKKVSEETTQ